MARVASRRPIDSFAPAHSPAARAGLTISYGRRRSSAPCYELDAAQECKNPTEISPVGFLVLATSYSRTAYRRTTIGAAAFHCRVRNGNGWGHCVIVTRNLGRPCRRKFLVRDS